MMRYIIPALLVSCIPVTHEAASMRRLTKQLVDCTNLQPYPIQMGECVDQSYVDCVDAGLRDNCAEDKFEGDKRRYR